MPSLQRFSGVVLALLALGAGVQLSAHAQALPPADLESVHAIPGLSPAQLASFARGRRLFEHTFGPADGLGPLFNNTSCRACHGFPNTGGSSAETATLVGGMSGQGEETSLKDEGGLMVQANAVEDIPLERIPKDAKFISKRISPPTFGDGLIEAVPVTEITAELGANPKRLALGIRGRANWESGNLGRFGWKSQKGDLIDFTQQACQFELGLSSPGRPQEHFPNVAPQKLGKPQLYDDPTHPWVKQFFDRRAAMGTAIDKPDLQQQQIEDMAAFQRFQAPVTPLPPTPVTRHGQIVFAAAHCDTCHVPALTTGPNAFGVPAGLKVGAYSDLLLHDMGEGDTDGLIMGVAKGSMWRTAPLWGLRYRERFMHDGRSLTLHAAIEEHGGEGAQVTAMYDALAPQEKQALIAFLKTL